MREEVAKAWSHALRGGKYEQGFSRLRKNDNFCALGVLADILDPQGWLRVMGSWQHRANETSLVPALAREIGIDSKTIGFQHSHPKINGQDLVYLNDTLRLSFAEIADLIDQYWQTI